MNKIADKCVTFCNYMSSNINLVGDKRQPLSLHAIDFFFKIDNIYKLIEKYNSWNYVLINFYAMLIIN